MALIYEYNDYKSFLRDQIKYNASKRGYQSSLARAAACQTSYLSQVLTGKAELMADHAASMASALGLSTAETEYFIELVNYARASSENLKKILQNKINQLKQKKLELSGRIPGSQRMQESLEHFYFTSWHWGAIHLATSTLAYQTPEALADRFQLPLTRIKEVLEKLEKYGLVKHQNKKWLYELGAGHMPRESIMTELNHTHWRHRALLDIQRQLTETIHYTSVFSMSKIDVKNVREFLVQTIAKSREITDPSEPEEIFCLSVDFFKV